MSFCGVLTLSEGPKNGPDVNGGTKFPGNFPPDEVQSQIWVQIEHLG